MDGELRSAAPAPMRVVIITLDRHMAEASARTAQSLAHEIPGLELSLHAAAEWRAQPEALEACRRAIASGDIIIVTLLFLDEHISAILEDLKARREDCDALVGCVASAEIVRLTKLGRLRMDAESKGVMAMLKRLRGNSGRSGAQNGGAASGAGQMKMLRRLPKILKFIPGTAQDLRAYFLTMQYWLAGSEANLTNLVRFLVGRYATAERAALRGAVRAADPEEYPDVGLYHPALCAAGRETGVTEDPALLAKAQPSSPDAGAAGTVGVLLMRAYLLSRDAAHYDGVIAALEAKGLKVAPAFAGGLDARPAIDRYFKDKDGRPSVDAVVSLTGFSLVGGPAYNDAGAAAEALAALDVPYLAAHALEFQSLEGWRTGAMGLTPIEATMMVAIPEIDGATGPIVFGGRRSADAPNTATQTTGTQDGDAAAPGERRAMTVEPERADRLASRVAKMIALRRAAPAERRVAVTLFNFPPNAGAAGTAAYLSVFQSLANLIARLRQDGYDVGAAPSDADALRAALLEGEGETSAARWGADAAVAARIDVEDHLRREPYLAEIEAAWGPAPGRSFTDGRCIQVLGVRFGNLFIGLQPPFGYEGDPMRLLFEGGFAPTHAFSAYYRWLREDFGAHAHLHFGTHGALEFMPGKQVGLSADCWPDRLIADTPNFYFYAANNPSEGAIAKRRSAATLISYLPPAVVEAGLYKGLTELKAALERWRSAPPDAAQERADLAEMIEAQAAALDLSVAPRANGADARFAALADLLRETEEALIPDGLHVAGAAPSAETRRRLLATVGEALVAEAKNSGGDTAGLESADAQRAAEAAVAGTSAAKDDAALAARLSALDAALCSDAELDGIAAALEGRFIRPAPGGDLLRTPEVAPAGRNMHGFDPFRIPSAYAQADGARQAERLLARHEAESGAIPETVAMVLWGSDNLKSEGGPMAQAMALMGARPRRDAYGRLAGAELVPLEELGRPRIDVMATLSGVCRDLLPLQIRMLAEAAYLAATADEPAERNFVRKHVLAHQAETGASLDEAALRVFSNAEGAYGSNVNQLVDSGAWENEEELADVFEKRKCFAYDRNGEAAEKPKLLGALLSRVDLAYQNLESVELGVTDIDHYFDTLGGVSRAVRRARGGPGPDVYIGDQTRSDGAVRTLSEQVALETRSRTLNPRWYESMLKHGYEGVRQIEAHVTNTMGWSATTGHVEPWVYQRISETFMLDETMRNRLAALNPKASAKVASRLLEASERNYWTPDPETLEALRRAGDELEDALEGLPPAQPGRIDVVAAE